MTSINLGETEMPHTILVVDDEESVRDVLVNLLSGSGYTALQAASGEEALGTASREEIDLVITDLKMPGISGLQLARALLEQDPDRPVALMTAYSELESAREAVAIGVYEYYVKPFNVRDVIAGVGRAVERRDLVLKTQNYQRDLEQQVEQRTRELAGKVRELEARDALLQQVLFAEDGSETLRSAVELALGLCGCDFGALHLRYGDGWRAGAVVGMDGSERAAKGLTEESADLLNATVAGAAPQLVHAPGPARAAAGVHSFGLVPVKRGDAVVGVLEIGRKRTDTLVGDEELEVLESFLPYVAIATADVRLHEDVGNWEENVDAVLEAAKTWGR